MSEHSIEGQAPHVAPNSASDGKYIHCVSKGSGIPVVMIHGLAASLHDWDTLAPALVAAGHRTHAFDLPGHGDSFKASNPDNYTPQAICRDVEDWLEGLDLPAPFFIIGHSLGGYVALSYALNHPGKIHALVLFSPWYTTEQLPRTLRYINRRPGLAEKLLFMAPLKVLHLLTSWDPITRLTFSEEERFQVALDYKRASPNIMNIPRISIDLYPQLHRLHLPALVVWGENDLTLKPRFFPRLVKALPQATGYAVANAGHQPHIGNTAIINPMVLDFLKSIAVDGGS